MSRKERARLTIMEGVTDGALTQVQAAELMGVCYRQGKRIWRRYQADGDAGLVHRLRGKPSARRKPAALREEVLALNAQERYADFGPTLMAEQLAKAKLVVDHETLRRWRMAAGQHPVRRRKQAHRQWRRGGVGAGSRYWNGIRARGEMVRATARLGKQRTSNKGDILS